MSKYFTIANRQITTSVFYHNIQLKRCIIRKIFIISAVMLKNSGHLYKISKPAFLRKKTVCFPHPLMYNHSIIAKKESLLCQYRTIPLYFFLISTLSSGITTPLSRSFAKPLTVTKMISQASSRLSAMSTTVSTINSSEHFGNTDRLYLYKTHKNTNTLLCSRAECTIIIVSKLQRHCRKERIL